MEPRTFDPELAISRAGGNAALAEKLIGMLIEELPDYQRAMVTAQQAGDWTTIGRHVHKLAGATLYTAVPALNRSVETLDVRLKEGAEEVDGLLGDVLAAIEQLLATPPTFDRQESATAVSR